MLGFYRLDEHRYAVPCSLEWYGKHHFADFAKNVVARSKVGDADISTVFLGINHQFGDGPPLLFETLVSGGEYDEEMERCSTWDQAVAQHARWCDKIKREA